MVTLPHHARKGRQPNPSPNEKHHSKFVEVLSGSSVGPVDEEAGVCVWGWLSSLEVGRLSGGTIVLDCLQKIGKRLVLVPRRPRSCDVLPTKHLSRPPVAIWVLCGICRLHLHLCNASKCFKKRFEALSQAQFGKSRIDKHRTELLLDSAKVQNPAR
jgi:hypothetical protein